MCAETADYVGAEMFEFRRETKSSGHLQADVAFWSWPMFPQLLRNPAQHTKKDYAAHEMLYAEQN